MPRRGLVTLAGALAPTAGPAAAAVSPDIPVCGVAGVLSGPTASACDGISNGGALIKAASSSSPGTSAARSTRRSAAPAAVAATASTALALAAIGGWVVGGSRGRAARGGGGARARRPRLSSSSTWFSSTYWRMAAIAALLTLPFLFAATVQAALRSDVATPGQSRVRLSAAGDAGGRDRRAGHDAAAGRLGRDVRADLLGGRQCGRPLPRERGGGRSRADARSPNRRSSRSSSACS